MAIWVGALIGFIFLVVIVVVIRFISKGSVLASLRGGVPMCDKAGTGRICELMDYEENQVTKKVRLRVNYFGSGIQQTGFWFNPKLDFYPGLDQVRWEDYMGTIICYKDLETGQKDYRQEEVRHLTEKIKALMRGIEVYKRAGREVMDYFEKQKVNTTEEKEVIKHSKALNAIKKLVDAGEANVSKADLKDIGMIEE